MKPTKVNSLLLLLSLTLLGSVAQAQIERHRIETQWTPLADFPEPLGVAGPFTGVHRDALIVAGGANFPKPVWTNSKKWLDEIYVLPLLGNGKWIKAGKLPRKMAYGASVSTKFGLLCIGGNDSENTFDDVFLLNWNPVKEEISRIPCPSLPSPCSFGSAALIGSKVYVAGGQKTNDLSSAMKNFWELDLLI